MQVFAIFKVHNPDLVKTKIVEQYPDGHYEAGDSTFFVATRGETTRQVATKVGLGDGDGATSGIVIPVTSYWGRQDRTLWEWISVQQNTNGG